MLAERLDFSVHSTWGSALKSQKDKVIFVLLLKPCLGNLCRMINTGFEKRPIDVISDDNSTWIVLSVILTRKKANLDASLRDFVDKGGLCKGDASKFAYEYDRQLLPSILARYQVDQRSTCPTRQVHHALA